MPRPACRPAPGPGPAPPAEPHLPGARPRGGEPVLQEPQLRIPADQLFTHGHHPASIAPATFPGTGSVATSVPALMLRREGAGDCGGMDLRTTVEHMFAPARHPGLVGVSWS